MSQQFNFIEQVTKIAFDVGRPLMDSSSSYDGKLDNTKITILNKNKIIIDEESLIEEEPQITRYTLSTGIGINDTITESNNGILIKVPEYSYKIPIKDLDINLLEIIKTKKEEMVDPNTNIWSIEFSDGRIGKIKSIFINVSIVDFKIRNG